MWFLLVTLVSVLCALIPTTQSQDTCQNPQGQQGICINIRKCSSLLNLLQSNPQDPQVGNYLRSSVCGYEGIDPLVCCPRDGGTGEDVDRGSRQEIVTTQYGPLYPPECGYSNVTLRRIVGGEPALLGAWPWLTALGYRNPRDPSATRWLCGGVLISRRHVLTAGHCVHGRNDLYKVRVGDLDLNDDNDGALPFEDIIEKRVVHPQYNPTIYTNDIAILKTSRDVPFTSNLHPICLPVDDFHRNKKLEATYPFVAGWGSLYFRGPTTSRLMQVQLPIRTEEECKNAFRNFKTTVIDNRILCAGYTRGEKDACQGDSGGPLMSPSSKYRQVFHVVGVVSYGFKCAEPGFPGVYTKVTSFLDFITSQLV
uniref:CLIP domain-containing serine protease n=1 Tax=Odontomachus monticola TaxID=613454 RepID=A0A348G5Y4_ODOMO